MTEQVSERQPNQIIGTGLVGVAIGDRRGNVVAANDGFLGIHGYTRDDMRAKAIDWRGLSAPGWEQPTRVAMALLYEHGISKTYDKEHVHRDGHRVPVSIKTLQLGSDLLLCTLLTRPPHVEMPGIDPQAALFAARERFALTGREQQALTYLLEGCTNAAIADALHICVTTVSDHVQNIMRKVGVQKRCQLFKRVILD